MPDNWEYPWFAAWDLAFHCVTLAVIDPSFAKAQLLLLTREWYMHPNGQLPAYEWRFGDVNPPVHAWAAWRVYQIDRRLTGKGDLGFLERVFHKLLLNFTWWVNRKDLDGANVFQGGFLGLDNIGLFDRDAPLPGGAHLGQADGTAWMGMFCLNMLAIALELAQDDLVYEDIATKFFEHFLYIAGALNNLGGSGISLWNEEDGFYYDVIHFDSGEVVPLRIRSLVGLIPLLAVHVLEPGGGRGPARLPAADALVPGQPAGAGRQRRQLDRAGCRRTAAALARPRRSAPDDDPPDRRPGRVPEPARDPVAQPGAPGQPGQPDPAGRPRVHDRLRAGRVPLRTLRRQLELAGAGLVPDQLPPDRGLPDLPPLPRWRAQGGDALRLGSVPGTRRAGLGPVRPPGRPLPARCRRRAARPGLGRPPPARPRPGPIGSRSTSTSTATTAGASGPATRPAGRPSSPSSSSRRPADAPARRGPPTIQMPERGRPDATTPERLPRDHCHRFREVREVDRIAADHRPVG